MPSWGFGLAEYVGKAHASDAPGFVQYGSIRMLILGPVAVAWFAGWFLVLSDPLS